MLDVEEWAEIRRLHLAEGLPIKEIARRLGVARNTVRTAYTDAYTLTDTPQGEGREHAGDRRAEEPHRHPPSGELRLATTV